MYNILPKTLFTGQSLIYLPTCHSTNEVAAAMLSQQEVLEGTVILTSHQTAGKGQRTNTWEAEPGKNLTFTLIYNPSFLSITKQFYLTLAVSVGIASALQELLKTISVKIKWPNDIYINDYKVCGILIYNIIKKNIIQNAVIGIGLNVNQNTFQVLKAGSLKNITGQEWDLENVLCVVLEKIEAFYQQLRSNNLSLLHTTYLGFLYQINEKKNYQINNATVQGMITGIEEDGRLQILIDNALQLFNNKEIEYLT